MRINNKGDIVPNKITNNVNYKNSFIWDHLDTNIHATFIGGENVRSIQCGLLMFTLYDNADDYRSSRGFVKVTILDT